MASHRKPRSRSTARIIGAQSPAVGFTTAAVASVTLLSAQSAAAAPAAGTAPAGKPSVEEVQRKVDDLYRQAGTAAGRNHRPGDAAGAQPRAVDAAPAGAPRTRPGALGPRASLPLPDASTAAGDRARPLDLRAEPRGRAGEYPAGRAEAAPERQPADAQASLRAAKRTTRAKLAEARAVLHRVTAGDREQLPPGPAWERTGAGSGTEALPGGASGAVAGPDASPPAPEGAEGATRLCSGAAGTGGGSYAAKAEKVLAFARAQLGKPYVRGAAGPSSYDCSGLTQAAWKAAGVELPRTAPDQAEAGRRVDADELLPGDLLFFGDGLRHVGIHLGDGRVIHAPEPGAAVREEPVASLPFRSAVRPA
ncbi:NlpC/P60 family protein [Streptomyces sp. NPDC030392]|uniref:C40 family peptidase n=2 Tax=unclassified Streptomyces TaxID=2593676 RepID=UPI0033CF18FA